MSEKESAQEPKAYVGALSAAQAAAAMQAARMNALDLMDTADILFSLKRFAHSVAFATLAVEEAGKLSLLLAILLGVGDEMRPMEVVPAA